LNLAGISFWGSLGLLGDRLLDPRHKLDVADADNVMSVRAPTDLLSDVQISSANSTPVFDQGVPVLAPPAPVYLTEVATENSEALPILAVAADSIPQANLPSNPDWQLGEEWDAETKAEFRRSSRVPLDENFNVITNTGENGGPGTPDGVTRMTHTPAFFDAHMLQTYLGRPVTASLSNNTGKNHRVATPNGDLTIDLLVDTGRHGGLPNESDEEGKDTWTPKRGAIFNVNYVDSTGTGRNNAVSFDDQGRPVNENKVILNEAYAEQLAPLVIKAMGPGLTPKMRAYVGIATQEQAQSAHFYPSLKPGTEAIGGGLGDRVPGQKPESQVIDVTPYVSQDNDEVMGVEGMFFRNLNLGNKHFEGYEDLTLFVVDQDNNVLGQDGVEMKVAPWIAEPTSQASQAIWAADYGSFNASFLYDSRADPGYYGLDHSGQFQAIRSVDGPGTQWTVDQAAYGYTQRPGAPPVQTVFRLPYFRNTGVPQPAWPQRRLLSPDVATFQLGVSLGGNAGDYGGNLAELPPTKDYPLGRTIKGDTTSSQFFTFLESQEVQPPIRVPTRQFIVGHVDEGLVFAQDGHTVVMADPTEAYRLLEAMSPADKASGMFFAKGRTPVAGAVEKGSTTTRIYVGDIDSTGRNWIRITADSGSGAAGQIARIVGRGPGYVDIGQTYLTGTKIMDPAGTSVPSVMRWMLAPVVAPNQTGLFYIPDQGDRFTLIDESLRWYGSNGNGTPAAISVTEALQDPEFRALNLENMQGTLDTTRSILENAAGKGFLNFVKVPTLYVGRRAGFATNRSVVAFNPGPQNLQPLNKNDLYVARQFGPQNAKGEDIFEQHIIKQLPDYQVYFTDVFNLYHRLLGEVHCGSLVDRAPYDFGWWA
jgi:hypothetical protein